MMEIDSFAAALKYSQTELPRDVLDAVRALDERREIEPFFRNILSDTNETPHGPAEIADILTHKMTVRGQAGLAAFILKGKSFTTVKPKDVAHQIYRLEKIEGLSFAVFATTGNVLDQAKEQFVSTARRTTKRYFILDTADLAQLFVGYGFICPRDGRRVAAGRCLCGYSPEKRIFNVLQSEALKELKRAHALKQRAGMVVLPPGSGKTRIAAEDARAIGAERVLYVAHTNEILDVAQSEFSAIFGVQHVQRLEGFPERVSAPKVTLLTIQSTIGKSPPEPELFDYVVVDEFHHVQAKSYRDLLEKLNPGYLLGLTATPFRSDRKEIRELCNGNTVIEFELRAGIEMGVLTHYYYYGCFDDVDYTKIKHNGSKYDVKDLERKLIIPSRDRAIIQKWKQLSNDAPTIAFCCSHAHAKRMVESFRKAGIPAESYVSLTSVRARQELQRRFQTGDVRVLCTVDVLNEGADFPYIECLLFLRPTESARIFYQQLGRGLRRYVGKSHCTVIDFIGNFKNAHRILDYHGLSPDADGHPVATSLRALNPKEILNLPRGCKVVFDDRVIDLFARQMLDPQNANRHTIPKILIYQYQRLWRRLGRKPRAIEVDRNCRLDSSLYKLVWGSWAGFVAAIEDYEPELEFGPRAT